MIYVLESGGWVGGEPGMCRYVASALCSSGAGVSEDCGLRRGHGGRDEILSAKVRRERFGLLKGVGVGGGV